MPVRINNLESELTLTGGEASRNLSENEVDRIASIVMQRITEQQGRMQRIGEETKITNQVSKPDLFD